MVDLARQAFSTKNFDLAADIYSRHLTDFGPSVEVYLGLADSLAKAGKITPAIQNYIKAYRLSGNIDAKKLRHLVDALIEAMAEQAATSATKNEDGGDKEDIFSCDICKALWNDPVTLGCGHTFCRCCLEKTEPKMCKCKKAFKGSTLRTNVLLKGIVDKWFKDELKAVKLRSEGNKLFQTRNYKEAIHVYSQALDLSEFKSFYFSPALHHDHLLCQSMRTCEVRKWVTAVPVPPPLC